MKALLNQLDVFERSTKVFKGLDRRNYHVFDIICHGRGWSQQQALAFDKPTVIRGTVIEVGGDIDGRLFYKVELDQKSLNLRPSLFSRRPYVSRVTGRPNPHIQRYQGGVALSDQYGVTDGGEIYVWA